MPQRGTSGTKGTRRHQWAQKFLRAVTGYSRGDCGDYLAQNQAGIRFLALAAVLIPSLGAFDGSLALALMLEKMARDKRLQPPTRHLKDLLVNLEHRCVQIHFPEYLVN